MKERASGWFLLRKELQSVMSFQIFSLLKKLYRISINLLPILIYFFPLNFFSLRENKRKVKEGSFRALGYVHCSLFMTCFFLN